ncbi:phospholipase D family protein [Pseudoxanthomonas yeongjuensis]|uniref:phospholipase D family protein n=1 Tax=Pseudoxanthomonas yeongjuensis TaxID=377616 RepID=UPI001B878FF2|nr:phospholipase D family protein [Pseudoxanthomonas yeongjuensis]
MSETAASTPKPLKQRARVWFKRFLLISLACYLAMAVYQVWKPLPEGIGQEFPLRPAGAVTLLTDVTYLDAAGVRHSDQQVFDEALRLIGQARQAVVLDMFLFNDFSGTGAAPPLRPLSAQLTHALVERKRAVPGLQAVLITDPINTLYGGMPSKHLDALRAAGIEVVVTDLARLRTPNPAWSGFWQLCCRWAGNSGDGGWLPSPFGQGKVTLRSYLALLNLNANHRKTLVADTGDGWAGLVASANPHDGSSAHGNVALRFDGAAALDLLRSERAVAALSGARWPQALAAAQTGPASDAGTAETRVQIVTEGRIRDALLSNVASAKAGEQLDIAVFYFSHRALLKAVAAARQRGVQVRVLLDPNEDAFGRKKNGIPNRQAALELHRAGVAVRWCDTHGEQCHAKLVLRRGVDGSAELIAGSANYTRRNLDDYNLESSARVLATTDAAVMEQATAYFEQSWNNGDGRRISLPYSAYEDASRWRYWRYRFTEATGLSSF